MSIDMTAYEKCTYVAMDYLVSAAALRKILETYEAAKAPATDSFWGMIESQVSPELLQYLRDHPDALKEPPDEADQPVKLMPSDPLVSSLDNKGEESLHIIDTRKQAYQPGDMIASRYTILEPMEMAELANEINEAVAGAKASDQPVELPGEWEDVHLRVRKDDQYKGPGHSCISYRGIIYKPEREIVGWQPIETAPIGIGIILYQKESVSDIFIDRFEEGEDKTRYCSHWMSLPEKPRRGSE